ncbi:MAG: hypothetical protein KC586_21230 [Myxococcales bacterium]|nr:hypothetical protein [Myxococcales bacterium]
MPRKRELLAEDTTPDGAPITLTREAGAFVVSVAGQSLMASDVHGSEEHMSELACEPLRHRPNVRVLVGGLGMGFTLRAALDHLGPDASVVVCELLPCLVDWNRGPLGPLAAHPLNDPRTELVVADLVDHIRSVRRTYDVMLLDVDNGPEPFTMPSNERLYSLDGLRTLREALRTNGTLVIWSGFRADGFEKRMRRAGFESEVVPVRARIRKGGQHFLYVGRAP